LEAVTKRKRSGTLNVPGIVGCGQGLRGEQQEMDERRSARAFAIRERHRKGWKPKLAKSSLNCSMEQRLTKQPET